MQVESENVDMSHLLQTKGVEIQNKVENKVAAALTQYQFAINKLRKSVFVDCKDLKKKITASREKSELARKEELQDMKRMINEEIVNVKKIKKIHFQLNMNEDFPLITRHYIPKNTSIKTENSSSYNLWNLCAFQTLPSPIDNSLQERITRQFNKKLAEKEIKELEQHRMNFICQYLVQNLSSHYSTMVILAKMIQKPPTSLSKFWFQLTKQSVIKNPQKVYAYRNTQYFCTVCKKYVCNLHYEEQTIDEAMEAINTEPDHEYSPYSTRFLVAYAKEHKDYEKVTGKKQKNDDDPKIAYHSLYKCPPKLADSCHLRMNKNNIEKHDKAGIISAFEKYEHEFILNYCLKYGFTNPCTIKFLLGSTQKKCWEIKAFIDSFPNAPKNSSPGDLISKAKATKKPETKSKKKKEEQIIQVWKHYVPCYHPGVSCNNCACLDVGYCETYCGCPKDCPLRFPGCNCKPGKCNELSCNCFKNNRECDPELCKNCVCDINSRIVSKRQLKTIVCPNTKIYYQCKPRLLLGKSTVCDGLGIFACHGFEKGDFIGEYVGEIIDFEEGDYRGVIYNLLGCSYMFDYEEEATLDSYFYGNKPRFANHGYGGKENSETKYKIVRGSVHIALYASREIKVGQEILFNYGDNYKLDWLLEYNERVRKEKKEEEKRKRLKKKKAERIDLFQGKAQGDVIFSDIEDN